MHELGATLVVSLESWESWDSESLRKVTGSPLQSVSMEQCASEVRLRLRQGGGKYKDSAARLR